MGKFVMKKTSSGYMFNLKSSNGRAIATSEVYKDIASCENGIACIQKNAPIANLEDQTVKGFDPEPNPKFEIYLDKRGEFRFRLKAANGQIVAVGEGYKAKASCLSGIASIRKNAPDASVFYVE